MNEVLLSVSVWVLSSILAIVAVVSFTMIIDVIHRLLTKRSRLSNVLFEDHQKVVTLTVESHQKYDIPVVKMKNKYSGKVERFSLVPMQNW